VIVSHFCNKENVSLFWDSESHGLSGIFIYDNFNYPFTMKNLSVCSGNITGTLSLEPGCRSKAHQSLCCIGCFDMPTLNKTYLINITETNHDFRSLKISWRFPYYKNEKQSLEFLWGHIRYTRIVNKKSGANMVILLNDKSCSHITHKCVNLSSSTIYCKWKINLKHKSSK
jgi:hypothetical protein